MKQLLKLTGCLAVAGLFVSCQSVQQEANYQVIPLPQEIVVEQGIPFILKSGVKILYPEGIEKMQRNEKFLADYLKTATGEDFTIEAGTEGKNVIILALGTENENPEAYQLKVAGDGVTITGSTEAGVFYGIQSLRKSLPIAVGANIHRYAGIAQHESFALAYHGRPGVASGNQEIPEADRNRFQ